MEVLTSLEVIARHIKGKTGSAQHAMVISSQIVYIQKLMNHGSINHLTLTIRFTNRSIGQH